MTRLQTKNALRLLQAADEFQARLSGEFAAVHGLSVNEFFLLMHLERATNQRLPRVELAKRMHVSASTVTRMVAPMEKTGMVAREVDGRDARFAYVVITAAGQTRLSEARATFGKQADYLFEDRWDASELEQLSQLLHRLVAGSVSNLS
ncbi:MAG: MarR family transcriptional regulator [Oceanicaulis sp.]|uniref:MarR family winged helix-turn-helix transcriptional regulator n=1 Tax=Glycocaulis sp. TaxID=1969725 RepID=UPI0025C001B1|nr:MarR family transcriptional regulator [Glycocaulis sp.]MCC5982018.1 MarR family transcriptional regulator [Oceanicaulis sp.]MCH8522857.1 MarR family transcriptional regulator [Glycocaulis sp.]